ncbi:phage portal protein [Halorussus sp. AFM4]|uniref:phage portal protein n=1 Tax=Halorussus sp. AFM4 TaxID=3421651 RepID=UPI003EBDA4B6
MAGSRAAKTTVAGETVTVEEPETVQGDDDTWLSGTNKYGWPRGREALEAREIVQTSAMQSITNGIVDQLVGGELAFESETEGEADGVEAEVQELIRDVLTGPHLMDDDLDDLLTAAVEDMMGPGNAYWQLLSSEDGSLPVVSLIPLDALTIRHNYNRHGYPKDPPYYQASSAFSGDSIASMSSMNPTPLQAEDLAVMHYPKGRRTHKVYPVSPSLQVREWLEILANSTTHHNRFYSDNEIPPGLIQIIGSQNVDDVKDKIQAASGDPRDVPVIGGEGGAQWIELGGTAVNLNIIEEQRWFFQMCLASLGLGKQELGFIEDVNRSNGEVESSRIYKRVTGPFAKQFHKAFEHIASQFDAYNSLDEPFKPRLRFTDPREERAREERLREMYNAGGLTLRQYIRRRGDDDLADEDLTVELNGETVDYGDHPKHVVDALLRDARTGEDANSDVGSEPK